MRDRSPLIDWTPTLYSKIARYYDLFARFMLPIGEKAKQRVANELGPGSVLDIACGTGALLALAWGKDLQCYGIDNAPGMLAEARKKLPLGDFKLASFYAIPYPDNTFNNVVETNAVSGVDTDVAQVISEMIRVCRPGGQVLIGDYCKGPADTFLMRLLASIGRLIGDYPHDFSAIFRQMGCEPKVEMLGWGGMYQFIKVVKP